MKRFWKTVLALVLCLTFFAALLPGTVRAADVVASGKCGDNLSWTLDSEGTLTISGTGKMWDEYHAQWFAFRSLVTSAMIQFGVTSIGANAFYDCAILTSVTIPESVTSIGRSAFNDCKNLTTISIPESVTSIDNSAFTNCLALTEINVSEDNSTFQSVNGVLFNHEQNVLLHYPAGKQDRIYSIPSKVWIINELAFCDCKKIERIIIPDGVTYIYTCAFLRCTSLECITIPNSVKSIYDEAFSKCISLTDVTIPNSITSINSRVFSDCTSLEKITIPDSVMYIGSSAFSGCTSLSDMSIPNSVTAIGIGAFSDCTSLTNVLIPNGVTSIGSGAFSGCTNLKKISIPNSVTIIDGSTFKGCTSLMSMTIPDNVTGIHPFAFADCVSLTSVRFPNSVTGIARWAFSSCAGLMDIYYVGTEEQWANITIYDDNDALMNATIHYGFDATPEHPLGQSKPPISGDESGQTALVSLAAPADSGMTVYGARFGTDGQFLGLTSATVSAGGLGTLIVPFEDGSYLRVFATDAQTGAPLCDCVTAERPE